MYVPGAPNAGPAGSASIKLLRQVCSGFQPCASPTQGRGPRHLLGANAAQPRPLPGPPPPPRVAHSAGGRVVNWSPGGLASPLPGAPWLQLALPLGPRRQDPPRGPRTFLPGTPREARSCSQCLSSLGWGSRRPHNPGPGACPAAPSRPRSAPHLRPRVGSAPLAGRSGAAHARRRLPAHPRRPPLTVRALRHLRRSRRLRCSPLDAPARCPLLRPRPGDSGIQRPAGFGGHPHAGHASRGRGRAPERREGAGPSRPRARRQPWIRGMRSACPFLGSSCEEGGDPGTGNGGKVEKE